MVSFPNLYYRVSFPIYITGPPSPIYITRSPSPICITGSPSPIYITGSPSPIYITGSPSPIYITESPSPIYITGSPSPIESRMNIINVRNWCTFLSPQNAPRYSVRVAFLNISSVCSLQNKRGINCTKLRAYLTQCLYFPIRVGLPCLFLSEISIYFTLLSHNGLS